MSRNCVLVRVFFALYFTLKLHFTAHIFHGGSPLDPGPGTFSLTVSVTKKYQLPCLLALKRGSFVLYSQKLGSSASAIHGSILNSSLFISPILTSGVSGIAIEVLREHLFETITEVETSRSIH